MLNIPVEMGLSESEACRDSFKEAAIAVKSSLVRAASWLRPIVWMLPFSMASFTSLIRPIMIKGNRIHTIATTNNMTPTKSPTIPIPRIPAPLLSMFL